MKSQDDVELRTPAQMDEGANNCQEVIELCSPEKDTRYPTTISMELSHQDPEVSTVKETPYSSSSTTGSPWSFINTDDTCLGVEVMATSAPNIHLLTKVMLYVEQLEIKNFKAYIYTDSKDENPLPVSTSTSSMDEAATLNSFDMSSYIIFYWRIIQEAGETPNPSIAGSNNLTSACQFKPELNLDGK
ncbi:hypothetical protein PanWU01x14_345400 [Parasponia andersonii]|uniref:Uncharacterized protein n=1 Tax=Parasponia andersonii TaxID=3476 RepID=A0A2P5ACP5_PARAD|nr:hypothetical protein PanWU01x14_345400 [Parasponia andersonii]